MMRLVKSYLGLCKLKVVALIVFTAMVGMFLATTPPGLVPWDVLLFGNLGIGLAASAAAAINHVLDARDRRADGAYAATDRCHRAGSPGPGRWCSPRCSVRCRW